MSITKHFAQVLNCPVKNRRTSWGSYDPHLNRVFLRVWSDERITRGEREFVMVLRANPRSASPGYKERQRHLDLVANGAFALSVMCVAKKSAIAGAREIEHFDADSLGVLGERLEVQGNTYLELRDAVRVSDISAFTLNASQISDDVAAILARDIPATTRQALVDARVGQGAFRTQVLASWGGQCAVTRSNVLPAIRASHIKPWRSSTDEERLCADNGIPLAATLDALFDAGLMTFDDRGKAIYASSLGTYQAEALGVLGAALIRPPTAAMKKFLKYHREEVFDRAPSVQ